MHLNIHSYTVCGQYIRCHCRVGFTLILVPLVFCSELMSLKPFFCHRHCKGLYGLRSLLRASISLSTCIHASLTVAPPSESRQKMCAGWACDRSRCKVRSPGARRARAAATLPQSARGGEKKKKKKKSGFYCLGCATRAKMNAHLCFQTPGRVLRADHWLWVSEADSGKHAGCSHSYCTGGQRCPRCWKHRRVLLFGFFFPPFVALCADMSGVFAAKSGADFRHVAPDKWWCEGAEMAQTVRGHDVPRHTHKNK